MFEFLVYFGLGYATSYYKDRPAEFKVLVENVTTNVASTVKLVKDNLTIERVGW